ncbi:MAG: FeoB-associated Cys-rich membrane protein [Spirochaetales bacterium]|nr:FeoB-associated Cys-rich membrane protein [Spirochaetales bacterium]
MGTAVVSIILAVIVAAIIAKMIIDKMKGKSGSCGGNCGACHGCSSDKTLPPVKSQSSVKTVILIDGMSCPMCESHINDVIRQTFSVQMVKSSHKTGLCEIISRKSINEDELRKAIEATGYQVKKVF